MKCPDDYRVVMVSFPGDILAAVRIDANGYPTIYINDALSLPARREALKHELRHLMNGDHTNHLTIYDAEKQAAGSVDTSLMPRSWRALREEEEINMTVAGFALGVSAEGPVECREPLPMPAPMFDRAPTRWANRVFAGW